MANADVVAYNIAAFIATLFLLEFGADKFIDHTAVVAYRINIPETVIGLVTAGGEWEELAVVIASLASNRASLAIGNIVGSAISNILGAFSLGLLFHDKHKPIHFDRSSRIYSLVLLVLTTFVAPITYFSTRTIWLVCGSILIVFFAIYIGSVGWAISKGTLTAPEDSESDGSSDDESSDGESTTDIAERIPAGADRYEDETSGPARVEPNEQTNPDASSITLRPPGTSHRKRRTLRYHLFYLFLGFLAICLAGYVLSHAAINIIDEFGISDVLFGVVILAIATTLPEKFVAVMSGHRGHAGILVANTAGSNIFLLALCSGIVMLDTSGKFERGNVSIPELGVLWCSTLAFTVTVWFGGRFCRWIGFGMLIAYIAFIVLEFTVIHGVANGN
ncbi:hypothetical protein DPSP01_013566 [Paraphaeosphaeria sporulosa]|uniref:Sodium/calcium exchanger membrane region domain-containing protein n=1 Tax=Paraphaeosphaeria sporulosa TaxID=1460663 RepID=A0A177C9H1_9PLEO|nr:uncharacterized protein CC84DRAFT_1198234 [Paraphaeosphaeria sporulosa]OAG03370.1 hypothetical protein CC84DRAFT_1198234 [Paraphaeosphaeria sporulosa]